VLTSVNFPYVSNKIMISILHQN